MFTRFEVLSKSESTLANVAIWKGALDSTMRVVSNPPSSMVRGRWLPFKSWKAVGRHVGSNISLKDREDGGGAGWTSIRSLVVFCTRATRRREGASRESKRDYLHFLYIARGSLSEAQYFIHLARRLKYLSCEDADTLHEQTRLAFGCLHGLIGSVEKEAGKVSKVSATATSLLAIALFAGRVVSGQ